MSPIRKTLPLGPNRRKLIKLTCHYGGAPGGDWVMVIEFRQQENRIQVWEQCFMPGVDTVFDEEPPLKKIKVLHGSLSWRRCATFLSRRDEMYAIPEEALRDAFCSGEKGWRAEALRLCWARYGQDKEVNFAKDLLTLTDDEIQSLFREFRSFTDGNLINAFWELRDLRIQMDQEKKSLGSLLRVGSKTKRPSLRSLLDRLAHEAERWQE